jgi:hypothetical protein
MEEVHTTTDLTPARRVPWNKGKLVGAKPPLRPSHVWSIRTKLQIEAKKRDLALPRDNQDEVRQEKLASSSR